QDPNLKLKRYFLTGGLVLCFIAPLIDISFLTEVKPEVSGFFLDINPIDQGNEDPNKITHSDNTDFTGSFSFFGLLYFAGAILYLVRAVFSFFFWFRIKHNSSSGTNKILFSDRNEVFSFFNYIHLPINYKRSEERTSLLYHEQAHIRQFHFIDLIITEIALLITWFNPFTWLMNRMIKENHEHLADREVLARGVDPAYYRAHLLNQTLGVPVFSFGQSFNHSLTKKRFDMMKNSKSKRSGLVKVLFLLPVLLLSLGFLGVSNAQGDKVKGKISFDDAKDPAHGVSVIVKGTTLGTITDGKGEFELEVPGKCEIVFSYVGYQTEVRKCKPGENMKLTLQPKTYEIEIEHPVDVNEKKSVPEKAKKVEIDKKESLPESGEVFYVVEEMPQFPGGLEELRKFIYTSLKYPEQAKMKDLEGRVLVKFMINTTGNVENPVIIHSTNAIFNEETLTIFEKMPSWSPGKQRGKPVKVMFTVPVYFKLPAGD
ncbi:MAG: TonB family protein, partial [bacterium]